MKNFIKLLMASACFPILGTYANPNPTEEGIPKNNVEIKMLSSFLFTANGVIADGNRVVFASEYSNAVDGNDALKLSNPGENFGLLRDAQKLAVEARQPIRIGDTLFYNMTNLVPQTYRLNIVPQNLGMEAVNCVIVDRFLNTRTNINLTETNNLIIPVTTDTASRSANRLMVVFTASVAVLPLKFTTFSAKTTPANINTLTWEVQQETDLDHYVVEKSIDGIKFTPIQFFLPEYKDELGGGYRYDDQQVLNNLNFYRIRSINLQGASAYSNIIKVASPFLGSEITFYPNPVSGTKFDIHLSKVLPGNYEWVLKNMLGQPFMTGKLKVGNTDYRETIVLDQHIQKGNYILCMLAENGKTNSMPMIIR